MIEYENKKYASPTATIENHHGGESRSQANSENKPMPAMLPAMFTVYASTRLGNCVSERPSCCPGPTIDRAISRKKIASTNSIGTTNRSTAAV